MRFKPPQKKKKKKEDLDAALAFTNAGTSTIACYMRGHITLKLRERRLNHFRPNAILV